MPDTSNPSVESSTVSGEVVTGSNQLSVALSEKDLQELQQNAVDYLYDLESSHNSLFALVNFSSQTTTGDSYKLMNSVFRAQSVSFNDYFKFEFDMQEVLRTPMLSNVTRPSSVKITYIEDVYQSIRKYHKDWMLKWYNPVIDVVRTGSLGKLRGCDIVLYHYVNNNPEEPLNPKIDVEPILAYYLRGMAPKGFPEVNLSMSDNKVVETLDIEYTLSRVFIKYNPKYQKQMVQNGGFPSEKNDISNDKISRSAGLWTPEPTFGGEGSKPFSYEGPRIARSIFSNLTSEGEA